MITRVEFPYHFKRGERLAGRVWVVDWRWPKLLNTDAGKMQGGLGVGRYSSPCFQMIGLCSIVSHWSTEIETGERAGRGPEGVGRDLQSLEH